MVGEFTKADEPSEHSGQFCVEAGFEISPDTGIYSGVDVVFDLVSGDVVTSPRAASYIGEQKVV